MKKRYVYFQKKKKIQKEKKKERMFSQMYNNYENPYIFYGINQRSVTYVYINIHMYTNLQPFNNKQNCQYIYIFMYTHNRMLMCIR